MALRDSPLGTSATGRAVLEESEVISLGGGPGNSWTFWTLEQSGDRGRILQEVRGYGDHDGAGGSPRSRTLQDVRWCCSLLSKGGLRSFLVGPYHSWPREITVPSDVEFFGFCGSSVSRIL